MSEEQKALIDLESGDRRWFGAYRVTRLRNGSWLFWSKRSQRIKVADSLPDAVETLHGITSLSM